MAEVRDAYKAYEDISHREDIFEAYDFFVSQKDYENAISIAENQRDWYQAHNKPTVDTVVYGEEITALDEELERLKEAWNQDIPEIK